MLRDALDRPLTDGFTVHGTDVETVWEPDVPLVTPNDRFFVRSHTRPPVVDADRWRLLLTGDGLHQDCTLSLADLRHLSPVTEELALECTGNGRQFFARQQGTPRPGTQWETGAIGVARWTGVPLARVLRRAGVRPDAVSVMAVGLDDPYVEDGVDHGRVRRPLPIEKALDDVLVCWEMNGEPLPPDHGHPVRLVVPGWVGIASIKWLGELRVTRHHEPSPWSTRWYRMHGEGWDGEDAVLGRMPVKSLLDTPGPFRAGEPVVLRGRAWSGEAAVAGVELSTDGGSTWRRARLVGDNRPSCWTGWELEVVLDRPGEHVLITRATDTDGRTQPEVAPDNDQGYLFAAALRQPVAVTR
jgi:DMSO/TMAO reductase YedYZ molybdopterin-dependent catalytic subunit